MRDFYNRDWSKKRKTFRSIEHAYSLPYAKSIALTIVGNHCFLLFSPNKLFSFSAENLQESIEFSLPEGVEFKHLFAEKEKIYLLGFCLNNCEVYCYNSETTEILWNSSFSLDSEDWKESKTYINSNADELYVFIGKSVYKLDTQNGDMVSKTELPFEPEKKPASYNKGLLLNNKEELHLLESSLSSKRICNKVQEFAITNQKLFVLEENQDIVLYEGKKEKSRILRSTLKELSGVITNIVTTPRDPNLLFLQLDDKPSNSQWAALLDIEKQKNLWIIHNDLSNIHSHKYKLQEIITGDEAFILQLFPKEENDNLSIYFFYDDLDYTTCDYNSGDAGYYKFLGKYCLNFLEYRVDVLQASEQENFIYANTWIEYLDLPKESVVFDDVDLSIDLEEKVIEHLRTGCYSQKFDSGPSDWFERIINRETIAPSIKCKLREIINNALVNPDSEVRAFALSTLDVCRALQIEPLMVRLIINNWHIFTGLRKKDDPDDRDRGSDALRLLTSISSFMDEGFYFAKKLAIDKVYGSSVLAGLAHYKPDWVIDNIDKIITDDLDPEGKSLDIIFFNLDNNVDRLKAIVKKLKGKLKDESLKFAIKEIPDKKISDLLMDEYWSTDRKKPGTEVSSKEAGASKERTYETILDITDLREEYPDIGYSDDMGLINRYNKRYPDSPGGYFFYGLMKLARLELNGTEGLFSKYIELRPTDPRGYYQRGLVHKELSEWKKALVDFQKVLKFGEFACTYENIGFCFYKQKEYEKAVESYKKACKINPQVLDSCIVEKSKSLLKTGEYDEVINDCNTILKSQPDNPEPILLRGLAYLELGNLDLAQNDFAKVEELSQQRPMSSEALIGQGRVFLKRKDYEKALEKLKESLSGYSANIEVYKYLAECYKFLKNSADEEKALENAKRAEKIIVIDEKLDADPKNIDLLLEKGKLLLELLLPGLARQCFNVCINIDEDCSEAYLYRAKSYAMHADYSAALNDFDSAIKLKPDFSDYIVERGRFYFAQNKFSEAEKDFSEVIKLDPLNPQAYLSLGLGYYQQSNLDDAIKNFDKALELDPDNAKARSVRGTINVQNGNYEQAVEDLTRAIAAGVYYGTEYLDRATAYKNLGNEEKELKDVENYIKYIPRDGFVDYYVARRRGEILYKKGKYVKAEKDFEYFCEGYPDDLEVKLLWGVCLAKNGKNEKALELLTDVAKNYLEPTARYNCYINKAGVLVKLKRFKEAVEDLQTLINDFPEASEVYFLLQKCYTVLKDKENAYKFKHLGKVISTQEEKIKPLSEQVRAYSSDAKVYIERGNIFYDIGFYDIAMKDFLKAIDADFYKQDPELPKIAEKLGLMFKDLGDKEKSKKYLDLGKFYSAKFKEIEELSERIEKKKDDYEAYAARGKVNLDLTRFYPAIEDFEKYFSKKGPEDLELQYLYGKALLGNVSYPKALEVFDKLIATDGKNPDYYYQRGIVFMKTKVYDKAQEDLEKAQKLGLKKDSEFKENQEKIKEALGE
ncbi:tetratricopeptide repeat protein [Candidatus Dojkabacteria bacterium]|nr:tetratricopeptide repeat protein [Candidatus Dojkabacteria bacterium]